MPNHKHSTPGPNCTMNCEGRHFRVQSDTENPVCDYENKGVKCDFFSSSLEGSSLPYPSDISLGQTATEAPSENNESMSAILNLLQQQKQDNDRKFNLLQEQISALSVTTASAPPTVPTATTAMFTSTTALPLTTSSSFRPISAPHTITSAATSLASHLQGGVGHIQDPNYQGLTMDQLRADQTVLQEANRLLSNSTQGVAPLNPLTGMGEFMGTLRGNQAGQVLSVNQLFGATIVNKQLRGYEFAATGQFSYRSQLKQDNCNAIAFAYGSFKHLEAVKTGLIKMSDEEFLARLRHLKNVYEVVCLSSNLTSFTDINWQVAREYDARVISDIESGIKNWSNLSMGLESDSIYCAKETVEARNRSNTKKPSKDPKDPKKTKDGKSRLCTTYNTHRSSEGCFWEHSNKGEVCVFDHFCSWCKTNRDVKEKHKALQCEHKPE